MKFKLFQIANLIILIPTNKTIKGLKHQKIINYNYTKTKNYILNCKNQKSIKKIVFIKKRAWTDILFIFEEKDIFIQGGINDNIKRKNKSKTNN